jgi:Na+/H+-translocating membrane pyrophosphatase
MHSLLGMAGVLGLIALAFGEHAAVRTAQAAILLTLGLGLLLAFDIVTGGALSGLVPHGRTCYSDC